MINQLKRLLKLPTYQPLNEIQISRDRIVRNYKYLSSINKKVKIAPVLKSNAYGHGIKEIAKVLDSSPSAQNDRGGRAPFFCVDSIYEAYELLKANVKTPILIMGYITPENLKVKKLPFSFAVSTLDLAHAISKYQPHAGVHIFVDTGMNREGVPFLELPQFLEKLPKNLKVDGLMSHLASADDEKDPLNKTQIKNFEKTLDICKEVGINPKWIHIMNSDGMMDTGVSTLHTSSVGNVARVGLALYGISNNPKLKPVLTLKSKIIQIKILKKDDRVGYSGTFKAKNDMTIGILPLGYYDGVDRRLSNKGFLTVGGVECPIIGLVGMNITTVDISNYINSHSGGRRPIELIGQEVAIYSDNPSDPNSIQNAAKICKTIPYDLLIHLASSTKRIIV